MNFEAYSYFVWIWIAVAIVIFVALLFITAPYGRHTKTTWGPLIDNRMGWIIMEIFVLAVLYYFVFNGQNKQSVTNYIILSLFTLHYVNRSLIFPFRLKTRGKKMPLVIMLMGITFNLVNGFIIGYFFGNVKVYDAAWLSGFPFIAGAILFFFGLGINWHSDTILIRLREPGETGYKIPRGGMFKYVSCPNLLGETIEWAGFALLTWSLPGLAFFLWTFANLAPRAMAHHRWYKKRFADYPQDRKIMIPYIF